MDLPFVPLLFKDNIFFNVILKYGGLSAIVPMQPTKLQTKATKSSREIAQIGARLGRQAPDVQT
jgi:hypothetical protein